MSDLLQKNNFVQQALYEKATPQGDLVVYQTPSFGLVLTLNGQTLIAEFDSVFAHEMMAHPALFTHPHPQYIAILGNHVGILNEVLKHTSVAHVSCMAESDDMQAAISLYFSHLFAAQSDARVTYFTENALQWLSKEKAESFDIIVMNQTLADLALYSQAVHRVLRKNGMLLMSCPFALMETSALKSLLQMLKDTAFHDWQLLHFPQPSCPLGWRTLLMGIKQTNFKRIREKDIFNKTFNTHYYNFDTHKAALALPEFMRTELDCL